MDAEAGVRAGPGRRDGDLDEALLPRLEAPQRGGRGVAQARARAARLHRGHEASFQREVGVPDGVDAVVDAVQATTMDPHRHVVLVEPTPAQLSRRDHPPILSRELRHLLIRERRETRPQTDFPDTRASSGAHAPTVPAKPQQLHTRSRQNARMDATELRATQAPLKERYANEPDAALVTLSATGDLDEGVSCSVNTGRAIATAGLHPATGGDGSLLCSGDMLLEALVACAGVTLKAVATSLEIPLDGGTVSAEGDLDFRGTLGVDKEAPVGFREIRLRFDLATDAGQDQLATLLKLTERYCVVLQTIAGTPALHTALVTR